jgi:hypothetical protein
MTSAPVKKVSKISFIDTRKNDIVHSTRCHERKERQFSPHTVEEEYPEIGPIAITVSDKMVFTFNEPQEKEFC